MSHKLVLTSVGVWKSHCFLRQLRRLSWVVFHSHERREWRGGGVVMGGAAISAAVRGGAVG